MTKKLYTHINKQENRSSYMKVINAYIIINKKGIVM